MLALFGGRVIFGAPFFGAGRKASPRAKSSDLPTCDSFKTFTAFDANMRGTLARLIARRTTKLSLVAVALLVVEQVVLDAEWLLTRLACESDPLKLTIFTFPKHGTSPVFTTGDIVPYLCETFIISPVGV
jgi:hypothetical protein